METFVADASDLTNKCSVQPNQVKHTTDFGAISSSLNANHVEIEKISLNDTKHHELDEEEKRLTQWFLLQVKQRETDNSNEITTIQKRTISKVKTSNRPNDQLYVNIDDSYEVDYKEQHNSASNSPSRLGRTGKLDEHYYPHLACSQERLKEIKPSFNERRITGGSIEWISCLLDDIEEKAAHMRNQNHQIVSELERINKIISNLKESPRVSDAQRSAYGLDNEEEMPCTPEINGYFRQCTTNADSRFFGTPSYANNLDNNFNLTFPKWRSRNSPAAKLVSEMSPSRTEKSQGHPLSLNGQSEGSLKFGAFNPTSRMNDPKESIHSPLHYKQLEAQNRQFPHNSASGIKERSMDPLDSCDQKHKESRAPWFARALSQISLTEPFAKYKKEKCSNQASYQNLPTGSQSTLNSQSNSPKSFASALLKGMRRKAGSPAPSPTRISSPVLLRGISEQRCMSLGHLKDTKRAQLPNQTDATEEIIRIRVDSPLLGIPKGYSPNGNIGVPKGDTTSLHPEKLPTHRRSPIRRDMFTNSCEYSSNHSLIKSLLKQYGR